ncbi:hypothetical protein C8R46DRAFT_1094970 [Mycena filopes]|nr:hypothetical protein C8R46DRAFT_1094970 [Mycena filopes]
MPTQVQQAPPPEQLPHDAHNKHANALHRDALLQALGSILAPRSSSASTAASPAHGVGAPHPHPVLGREYLPQPHQGLHSPPPPPPPPHSTPVPHPHPHPHPHAHPHSPLADSSFVPDADADQDAQAPLDADAAGAPTGTTAAVRANAKFINSLKSKNGAWDALIHGSFS